MFKTICIAGKNNIAVQVSEILKIEFPGIRLTGCCNKNDDGQNHFHRSFKSYCNTNQIEIFELEDLYLIEDLIFLSLEFDRIIKPELFKTKQLYNIHFSLLPEYKGMYTSALPILHAKEYSGVSFHRIDAGIDTGDVIDQTRFDINDEMTSEILYNKYTEYGIETIRRNLTDIVNDNCRSIPQSNNKSTYFSKSSIDYSNIQIDLNKTAFEIKKQINAFVFPYYQMPKIFGHQVYRVQILNKRSERKPGSIITEDYFSFVISTIDFDIRIFKYHISDLIEMAKKGDLNQLNSFIENGYDIRQRTAEGWDIAIIAAYNGQNNFLDFLIENLKWDVNSKNRNGTTLAMYVMTRAAGNSQTEYLKKFLSKDGIDLNLKDYFNKTIFEYSIELGNENVTKLLNLYSNHNAND